MEFEQFEKLVVNDRVTLLMALELLMQNGRRIIQTEETSKLIRACESTLGNFIVREKLGEIVTACKDLADTDLSVLICHIRHSSMDIKVSGAEEPGICPICGCELEREDDIPLGNGGVYKWTCPDCSATGREGYKKVFDKHYDVRDGEGNPYPALSK